LIPGAPGKAASVDSSHTTPKPPSKGSFTVITRRQAIKSTLLASALATPLLRAVQAQSPSPAPQPSASPAPTGLFTLPPLPYGYDALEPYIDTLTMQIHHDKHHATYVKKLNEAVAMQPALGKLSLEDILKDLGRVHEAIRKTVRNQAGGDYNHTLFWQMMKPQGGGEPQGDLAAAINNKFGSFAAFKTQFSKEAMEVFGSGWAWLVLDGHELEIDSTPNQDSPITAGKVPLLGLDVWEHAYYLKNQNRRADYVAAWWNVINWDFVSDARKKALG
jgi:Fe-Mn family superoxide dismutase